MCDPNPYMDDALFAELLQSVREGGAILRGEHQASRTFVVDQRHMDGEPAPPRDPASSHAPYPFKWTRRVALLLACLFLSIFVGGITSIIITRVDSAGYFVRWQHLPDPPAVATSLALMAEGSEPNRLLTLVARLASGESAALPLRTLDESGWQPSAPASGNAASPCAPSLPALARTTNPPDGLTGCIFYFSVWADCDQRLAFALDGDGRVWQWDNGRCALGTLGMTFITFVASGLIYLLLFSILMMVWLRRRERAGR